MAFQENKIWFSIRVREQSQSWTFWFWKPMNSLLTQVATAYQRDMGVISFAENTGRSSFGQSNILQPNCRAGQARLANSLLNLAYPFMSETLAASAVTVNKWSDVQAGSVGPRINLSGMPPAHHHDRTSDFNLPRLSGQRIHPYTDFAFTR